MHPLISIEELAKLSDSDLRDLEACLSNIILTHPLEQADLRRCLASLSNAVYLRSLKGPLPSHRPS
jgi:hypothetical protein